MTLTSSFYLFEQNRLSLSSPEQKLKDVVVAIQFALFKKWGSQCRLVSALLIRLHLVLESVRVKHQLSFYATPLTFTYRHVTLESSKPKKLRPNIFPTSYFWNLKKTKQINKPNPQSTGKLFSNLYKLFPCSQSDSSARLGRFLGEKCAFCCCSTYLSDDKTLKITFRYRTANAL